VAAPKPYSIGIYSIARKIQPYSGGRVWAEPRKKGNTKMPGCDTKKTRIKCINQNIMAIL